MPPKGFKIVMDDKGIVFDQSLEMFCHVTSVALLEVRKGTGWFDFERNVYT